MAIQTLNVEPAAISTGEAHLTATEGGEQYVLAAGATTIGAGPKCDLRLDGAGLRPLHCVITCEQNIARVRRWATGALLNGKPFTESSLSDGDCLKLGSVELQFHVPVPKSESAEVATQQTELSDADTASQDLPEESNEESHHAAETPVEDSAAMASDGDVEIEDVCLDAPQVTEETVTPEPSNETDFEAFSWEVPSEVESVEENPISAVIPATPDQDGTITPVPAHLMTVWENAREETPGDIEPTSDSPAEHASEATLTTESELAESDLANETDLLEALPDATSLATTTTTEETIAVAAEDLDESCEPPSEQAAEATLQIEIANLREAVRGTRARVRNLIQSLRDTRRVSSDLKEQANALQLELEQVRQENCSTKQELDAAVEQNSLLTASLATLENALKESHDASEAMDASANAQEEVETDNEISEPESTDLWSDTAKETEPEASDLAPRQEPSTASWSDAWDSSDATSRETAIDSTSDAALPADPTHATADAAEEPIRDWTTSATTAPSETSSHAEEDLWDVERTDMAPADTAVNLTTEPTTESPEDAWGPEPSIANASTPADTQEEMWSLPESEPSNESAPSDTGEASAWLDSFQSGSLSSPEPPTAAFPEPPVESEATLLPEETLPPFDEPADGLAKSDANDTATLETDAADASEESSAFAATLPDETSPKPTNPTEQDAPGFEAPKSFLEQYSHLLPSDEENATDPPAPLPAPVAAPLAPPVPAEVDTANEEEDIDSYMSKLLSRMRDGAAAVELTTEANPSPVPNPAAIQAAKPVEAPAPDATPFASLDELKRSAAPEQTTDISSLRQLANQSARHAIGVHASKQNKEKSLANLVIANIALASGGYLVASSPSLLSTQFLAGSFAILLAGVWVFRSVTHLVSAIRSGSFDSKPEREEVTQESLPISH